MFRRRGLLLVVLSLGFGAVAAWGANNFLNARLADGNVEDGMSIVVAAALDIPYGTKVEERHLKFLKLPEDSLPENAFPDFDSVLGQVARNDVDRGQILLQTRFAEHGSGSTLAALVQNNMRAVTVRVDDVVGVAGFLLPGNRVDVLSSRTDISTKRAVTDTVLGNIKVLAVDQTASTVQNEPLIVRAVTLEVTPAQSLILLKAKEEGRIQLTLRNPLDQMVASKAPELVVAPVKKVAAVRPARAAPNTIQIIRGTSINKERTKL